MTTIEDNGFIHIPGGSLGIKTGKEKDSGVLIVKPGQRALTVLSIANDIITTREREAPTQPLKKRDESSV